MLSFYPILGLILLIQGIRGDVPTTPYGSPVVSKWFFIMWGSILILFKAVVLFSETEMGMALFNLQ